MISTLLSNAKKTKSFLCFPPAGKDVVEQTNQDLSDLGCPVLPQEICLFLDLCDGLYYDGLELFGAQEHPRPTKEYTFTSLIKANKPFLEYSFFCQKIIIGSMSENFIIYDAKNKLFAVIDRINLCSQIEFSSFEDLFLSLLHSCDI